MNTVTAGLVAVACTITACSPSNVATSHPPPLVHVIFVGALIGPTKPNGCQWDVSCDSGGASAATRAIGIALKAADPVAAIGLVIVSPLMTALEKPDAEGRADLFVHGTPTPIMLHKRQDSFTPTWNDRWDNVVLDSSVRLHVMLHDADLVNDDDIGSFDLSSNALLEALRNGTTLGVPVADQTFQQVLFAQISVVSAR